MDISAYQVIYEKLKEYNDKIENNYGNMIVDCTPKKNASFPVTVFREVRNEDNDEETSSLGFSVTVFAKSKGDISKVTIAREVSAMVDSFMKENFGLSLKRISYNIDDTMSGGTVCAIVTTYYGKWYNYRKKFI